MHLVDDTTSAILLLLLQFTSMQGMYNKFEKAIKLRGSRTQPTYGRWKRHREGRYFCY